MIFHQPDNSRGNYHFNSRFYSGHMYAPHFHKNMELILVLHGSIIVTINGLSEKLNSGDVALVLSNQIHAFSVPDDSNIWVAVFSEDYVPAFSNIVKGKQGTRCRFVPEISTLTFVKEHIVDSDCSLLMKKACFYALCDQYLQQVELENRPEKSNFMVGQILDWIAMHYTEDISLQQAAKVFGYEYHYLSRLLNKNYAISFTALLNAYRVEHAMKLLRGSDMGVTEISEASGFQSIRSFNFCFRRLVGMTPNDYRYTR